MLLPYHGPTLQSIESYLKCQKADREVSSDQSDCFVLKQTTAGITVVPGWPSCGRIFVRSLIWAGRCAERADASEIPMSSGCPLYALSPETSMIAGRLYLGPELQCPREATTVEA